MNDPTRPVWSVIIMLVIGLGGTIWWIYDILKLAFKEMEEKNENISNH